MNDAEKRALCAIQCATCARRPKNRAEICYWYSGEVCEQWRDFNDGPPEEADCLGGSECSECERRDFCPDANPC